MSKIYYTNSYQVEFTAEILSIKEKDDVFHIVLDQTAFYPEGGGQPSDIGFIEDSPISHVYEENDIIYHVSHKKPIKIHKAKCHINWAHRFDHMQHHLAQHLFSAYLEDSFQAHTLSFHLGKEICTIDIDKILSAPEISQAQLSINELISANLLVTTLTPSKQELKKFIFKKPLPKVNGPIRLVQIGDLDISACCGTHPNSTVEIQMFKILKSEKHKTGTRITFIAGHRAIKSALNADLDSNQKLKSLSQECSQLLGEVRKLKGIIADYQAKDLVNQAMLINEVRIIKEIYTDIDNKELQNLGTKLVSQPNVIALLGLKLDKTSYLIFMSSKEIKKVSMNTLLKDSITFIDGRGGGNDHSAQGGGKSANNLEPALDYAFMKLKSLLSTN
ncbi:MAG: alanyl-tRNA editing protein [Cellulosilyticaceae bacterium]